MQLPIIKSYNPNLPVDSNTFYILCKGLNAGKPLTQPCPNCFTAICQSKKERDQFYWLTYSLWKSNSIKPHLIGSVIPFIRIREYKSILANAFSSMQLHSTYFNQLVKLMIQHEAQAAKVSEQLTNRQQMIQRGLRYCIR